MVIHNIKARERKGDQQYAMVIYCKDYWQILKNVNFQYYTDVMNMKTSRRNDESSCGVALTYRLKLNKW